MKRVIPVLAVVLVLGAFAFTWWSKSHTEPAPVTVPNAAPTGTATATAALPKTAVPPPPNLSPEFSTFLVEEARSLDSTKVDAQAAEARVLQEAERMGETEIRYARDLVLSAESPANLRVMAIYALTKAGSKASRVLKEIALPPTNSARAEPHTLAEHQNVQAKSFALMAIDALAEQAKTDPALRDELVRLASSARDSTIQQYIEQKIRELPPL